MADGEKTPQRVAFVINALAGKELKGGKGDAARVYDVLVQPDLGACDPGRSRLIPDCPSPPELLKSLAEALGAWQSEDQLVFYFSGHGEKTEGYYCLKLGLSDDALLPFDNVRATLAIKKVRRAILILDACFAGAAMGGTNKGAENASSFALPKGIAILGSSTASEFSHELPDGSSSVFTKHLTDGIRSGLDGQATNDGFITVGDIIPNPSV